MAAQRAYVLNDLDDRALVARVGLERELAGLVYFSVRAYGSWRSLAEPGALSRAYPTRTRAFTTLGPGLGAAGADPGVYSAGTYVTDPAGSGASVYAATTGQPVAQLGNPVLGALQSVTPATLTERRARAQKKRQISR